jgi:hypothetical protein
MQKHQELQIAFNGQIFVGEKLERIIVSGLFRLLVALGHLLTNSLMF